MNHKKATFLFLLRHRSLVLIFLTLLILFKTVGLRGQNPYEGKTILAIFAHPDDESTIAPILARYTREGAKVYLVIVTDGRYGTNDFHDHKAGETLVATRREEMKCAANQLGAELIHLDYHDQLKADEGYDGHVPHARAIVLELKDIIEMVRPDVLITWGPDGGSTHMDHRLVGASVTQVYLSKQWEKPMALFFYGTPTETITDADNKTLRGQHKKYLRTKISYSEVDLSTAFDSYKCHYSQIDPKLTKEEFINRRNKNERIVYLRKFEAPSNDADSVFE
ncbi:PIG-L family deacetylase [uncultured Maribacter sp.]|uniref:PIG-L deacetylase family protein n=1 Tax=uncultured Maribacter sp. TaxID=431308 RepID=UPI0030D80C21|tara:strand:- start:966 stop:1805 length:840 start_codon:yes stop_codon:yes gene_type:complete